MYVVEFDAGVRRKVAPEGIVEVLKRAVTRQPATSRTSGKTAEEAARALGLGSIKLASTLTGSSTARPLRQGRKNPSAERKEQKSGNPFATTRESARPGFQTTK